MIKTKLSNGTLHITEEVLAIITHICVEEVEEVAYTVSGFTEGIAGMVNKHFRKNGITITNQEDSIAIDIKVALYFGTNITEVCEKLQELISQEIKVMTGINVSHVTIKVEQVIVRTA